MSVQNRLIPSCHLINFQVYHKEVLLSCLKCRVKGLLYTSFESPKVWLFKFGKKIGTALPQEVLNEFLVYHNFFFTFIKLVFMNMVRYQKIWEIIEMFVLLNYLLFIFSLRLFYELLLKMNLNFLTTLTNCLVESFGTNNKVKSNV